MSWPHSQRFWLSKALAYLRSEFLNISSDVSDEQQIWGTLGYFFNIFQIVIWRTCPFRSETPWLQCKILAENAGSLALGSEFILSKIKEHTFVTRTLNGVYQIKLSHWMDLVQWPLSVRQDGGGSHYSRDPWGHQIRSADLCHESMLICVSLTWFLHAKAGLNF